MVPPAAFIALAPAAFACGAGDAPPVVATIDVTPDSNFLVGVGTTLTLTATARDAEGGTVNGIGFTWTSANDAVATVNASTGMVSAVQTGTATITAEAGTVLGTARVEVYVSAHAGPFDPAQSYWGRQNYVEYRPGNLPIVLSAPHGGSLTPTEIPDRTYGTTATDRNTGELALQTREAIFQRTGRYPHVVISHLQRAKLDPNREIVEAAQGNAFAELAWNEFHDFIAVARQTAIDSFQTGFYLDYHGHGHAIQRLELGYLLSASDLALSDADLNQSTHVAASSVRSLVASAQITLADLIRGASSLGTLLAQEGFPAVPSTAQPNPGSDPYFTGGYDTRRYGSRDGGPVSGVQVEAHYTGVRDTETSRDAFAAAMTDALEAFLLAHYGLDWRALPH